MKNRINLAAVNRSLALHGERLSSRDFVRPAAANVDLDAVNRSLECHGEELSDADLGRMRISFVRPNPRRAAALREAGVLSRSHSVPRKAFVSRSAVNRSLAIHGEEV